MEAWNAVAVLLCTVASLAGVFYTRLWILFVLALLSLNVILISSLCRPQMTFPFLHLVYDLVALPFLGLIDWGKLLLPKPYLYLEGNALSELKGIPTWLRRVAFISSSLWCMEPFHLDLLLSLLCSTVVTSSVLFVTKSVFLRHENSDTRQGDWSASHGTSIQRFTARPFKELTYSYFHNSFLILIVIACFAYCYISMMFVEIVLILSFSVVTDSFIQHKCMDLSKSGYPYLLDGLAEYAGLGCFLTVDFVLCVRLFGYALIHTESAILICITYSNMFAAVMEFIMKVWFKLREEIALIANMRHASKEKLLLHNDVCAICLGNMTSARITACQHLFHGKCLRFLLRTSTQCPMCKCPITSGPGRIHAQF